MYLPVLDPHDRPVAPILSLDEAATHPDRVLTTAGNLKSIVRPGSQLDWAAPDGPDEVVLGGVACRVVRGAQASRTPQLHFYMEPQAAIAVPGEPGPTSTSMRVITSTQNPVTVRNAVAGALGLPANLVEVDIQRLGGGYGGKGPRTPWCGALAAVAARKHRRPVRLGVPRETDTALFGHANPLTGRYAIAIGTGADQADHRGKLMGLSIDYWLDAGNTADCSPIVMDCVQLRGDNAYRIPNYQTTGRVVLTNTISNTSFRTLEAVSGVIILEDALEHAAHAIGMAPEDVRGKNLYQLGDLTPYGQSLAYCYLDDVWAFTRTSWPTAQDPLSFEARAAAIAAWNTAHRWKKRGISMVPVKYGMGFNLAAMERGDALVEIHADGSVLVRHGGVEMGQGLNTQVTQLVAQALNVALSRVRIGTTSTAVIPDPTSTGASTGTAYNGGAARKAGQILRARLEAFCAQALREHGRAWCQAQHIDYWSYDRGWQHVVDAQTGKTVWDAVIGLAGAARVNLSAQAQHDETGGTASDTGLVF